MVWDVTQSSYSSLTVVSQQALWSYTDITQLKSLKLNIKTVFVPSAMLARGSLSVGPDCSISFILD